MAKYRNPGPRRGEARVGSGPDVAFPADLLQNSVRLIFIKKNNVFGQLLRSLGPILAKSMFLASNLKQPKENQCF